MKNKTEKVLQHRISKIMECIRKKTPLGGTPQWQKPSALFHRDDYLYDQRVKAASITLLPSGCEYAKKGGCTMCGEWSGSNLGNLVPAAFHVAQFASSCADIIPEKIEWLRIYQEGSFLNSKEVESDARDVILRLASNIGNIRRITIESRPEYLTDNSAKIIRSCVRQSVELEIGIGLEAQDDFIRNVCINKGTSLTAYKRAVKSAHSNGIIALAYVLIKPPFLSEKEAIDEAIKSVVCAFEMGFDEVYVQAASIHEWSMSELLWLQNLYTLPWLWSVLEVIKHTAHFGKVKIGGLEYFPIPATISQNYVDKKSQHPCDCSQRVWILIQEFNATNNANLLSSISCSCQSVWKSILEETEYESCLSDRVLETIDSISLDKYFENKNLESRI